jgi:hypothetical protein
MSDNFELPSALYSGATGAAPTKRSTRSSIKLQPDVRQLKGLFAALKEMDKESNAQLRDDVSAISAWSATQIKRGAYDTGVLFSGQSKRVSESVRHNRDRVPNVTIGGSKLKFSGGAVSGMIVMGNEWGSAATFPNGGQRFPRGLYPKGNWIFPTLRAIQPEVTKRWKDAVTKVLSNWEKGAGGGLNG